MKIAGKNRPFCAGFTLPQGCRPPIGQHRARRNWRKLAFSARHYIKEMGEADEEGGMEGWARKQQALANTTVQLGATI